MFILLTFYCEVIAMKFTNRQKLIYDYIKKNREVSTNSIAQYFNISPVTVRRYLDRLESNNLIIRKYGKAILSSVPDKIAPFSVRSGINEDLKQRIAKLSLPYLLNASSAFLDASSTASELLKLIPVTQQITIYTTNAAAFQYLSDHPHVRLFMLGGYLNHEDGLTLDSKLTAGIAKSIFPECAFISCAGFTKDGIFDNVNIDITNVKQIILKNTTHNFLLADHTKHNKKGIFQIASWDLIQTLICDSSFNRLTERILESKKVQIVTQ